MTTPSKKEIRALYEKELARLTLLATPYEAALPALRAEDEAANAAAHASQARVGELTLAEFQRCTDARARLGEAIVNANARLLAWRAVRTHLSGILQLRSPVPHISSVPEATTNGAGGAITGAGLVAKPARPFGTSSRRSTRPKLPSGSPGAWACSR